MWMAIVEVRQGCAGRNGCAFGVVEAKEVLIQPRQTDPWNAETRLRHTDLLAGWRESRLTKA
jgi:hypothetical protein